MLWNVSFCNVKNQHFLLKNSIFSRENGKRVKIIKPLVIDIEEIYRSTEAYIFHHKNQPQ